ncbi:S8 family serine peptidase [Streptomyces sp. NPDC056627]|uniref:S8 family serine peptidase n=1 Tax=unclassified Streptomyces TaxID=2593676 RepID=UPI00093E0EFE|nr:peptidase [Streptomyces sp. CB02058]
MRRASCPRASAGPGAAAVLAALTAALTTIAPTTAVAADSVQLPVVRGSIAPGEPCVAASGRKAEAEPWSAGALGLARAWTLEEGDGVTVAVVDTGVGADVPALAGRVRALGGAGEDCVGHGSFAAGLIAGARIDGVGPAGVAPRAAILAVRGTDERGAPTPGRVAAGIRAAADEGAEVVYVGQALATGKKELTEAVAYAAARDALVVAPVAPDALAEDRDEPGGFAPAAPWYWPASAPGVVAVTDFGPDGGRPANAPGVRGADLAAPGDAVVGNGPEGAGHYLGSGASLAAAQVAGAAALVRAQHPGMTAAQAARQLTGAAYPASPPRLDPYAAMTAVLAGAPGAAPEAARARMPAPEPEGPRDRALLVAGICGGVVLLLAGAAAVLPRGRARGWRPAGGA